MKKNDVYRFQYNQGEIGKMGGSWFADHCFDGQFVVKEEDGKLYFVDTYWSFGNNGDSKRIEVSDAKKKGKLMFVCNLNDVEEIDESRMVYFADKDLFNLSYQHGCYKFFAVRKGAERNSEKMLSELNNRIQKEKKEIEYGIRRIEQLTEQKTKLEGGNLDIFI